MREFIEYKREFTMQPNRVITISGYRVAEPAMAENNVKDFADFEAEAEDLIKMFRDQVEAVESSKENKESADMADEE